MKIFLVVAAVMSAAYRESWHVPVSITPMASMATCEQIGKALIEMEPRTKFRCVEVKE